MKENNNQEKKNIFVEMEDEVLAFWKKNKIFKLDFVFLKILKLPYENSYITC